MRRILVVLFAICLAGCTATSALKAVTSAVGGGDSGLTAQVGAENTRQGIGATVSTEDKNETTVKESTVGTIDSSKDKGQKAQNISTGSITAERIIVKNNDSWEQIGAFTAGGILMLLGCGVILWTLLRERKARKGRGNA